LSTTNIGLAQRDLVNNKAMPFSDGYFAAVISPYPSADFKQNSTWVNAASYSNVNELYKGEIGRWYGFRFVETTQPYRDGVTGVAASFTGGAMFHNLFLGRNAFGHTEVGGGDKIMHVLTGADKSDPLDMNTLVGWKQVFADKAITAPHVVDVVTGATA
jgi:N4-gp56 family major capsid protein